MATSSMSASFAKCFILFMAIVILLEGALYLGLAIWGLTQEKCSNQITNVAANPFGFATDLIYFISESCGNPTVSVADGESDVLEIDWAQSYVITHRMYALMITYAVISGLWIISSLMVIFSICGAITSLVVGISFWPWFLLVIGGSILDVVATGFFGSDIANTRSAADTFAYVGVINADNALLYLNSFDAYFMTPAVVMTCISSRVILIWLLNIFGSSFCLSLSRVLASNAHPSQDPIKFTTTSSADSRKVVAATATAELVAQPQQYQTQVSEAEQYPAQIRPKPLPIQTPTGVVERQSFPVSQQSPDRHSAYEPPAQTKVIIVAAGTTTPVERNNELARQPSSPADAAITYRNTDTHPDRLNYPPPQSASAVDVRVVAAPELSTSSLLNNRYSTADTSSVGYQQRPPSQSQQRVSDELRSQLPWSYTSVQGGKPQPPRKPVKVYPQIPEPDYGTDEMAKRPPSTSNSPTDVNSTQAYSRW